MASTLYVEQKAVHLVNAATKRLSHGKPKHFRQYRYLLCQQLRLIHDSHQRWYRDFLRKHNLTADEHQRQMQRLTDPEEAMRQYLPR